MGFHIERVAAHAFNSSPCRFVFALIGAIIFSAYIVYDTDNIIKRYSYDDYVWASVGKRGSPIDPELGALRLA